jgi:hypothetical protein
MPQISRTPFHPDFNACVPVLVRIFGAENHLFDK